MNFMRQKVSKVLSAVLLTGIVCSSLTGCGGEYADVGADRAVSGNAVSAGAVSGSAVSEENEPDTPDRTERHRYCTDTNLYLTTEDGMVQCRLDGTHKKMLTVMEEDITDWVEYADREWLYYREVEGDGEDVFYRVPIEKDASGYDDVKMTKREKLLQDYMYEIYVDSDYCFYTTEEYSLIKFDLEKKQKVSEVNIIQCSISDIYIFRMQDTYLFFEEDSALAYAQAVDDTEWQSFHCQPGNLHVQMQQDGADDVYYSQMNSDEEESRKVRRINAGQREGTSFVTEKELKQEIEKAVQIEEEKDALEYFQIMNLFSQGERVYLMVEAGWENNDVFYMQNLIFSKRREDSELRFEKKLTECMHDQNTKRTGEWKSENGKKVYKENVVYDDASCVLMVDGKAYLFCYDYEKEKARVGCYELASGRFWWIKKGDADYMALFYDYHDEYFEGIFEKNSVENDFCEGLTGYPSEDKEYAGEFFERKR